MILFYLLAFTQPGGALESFNFMRTLYRLPGLISTKPRIVFEWYVFLNLTVFSFLKTFNYHTTKPNKTYIYQPGFAETQEGKFYTAQISENHELHPFAIFSIFYNHSLTVVLSRYI